MNNIDALISQLCLNGVEFRELGEIAEIGTGNNNRIDATDDGPYPFYVRSKEIYKIKNFAFDEEAIIIPGEGGIGEIFHYINGKYGLHQRAYRIHLPINDISTKFIYYYMMSNFKKFILQKAVNATVSSIRKPMIEKFLIPIPSITVQQEIVNILDKFTQLQSELEAELQARRIQYKYYRNELLNFDCKEIELKPLSEVCLSISAGGDLPENYKKGQTLPSNEYPYPIFANATDAKGLYGYTDSYKIESDAITISARGAKIGYHTIREAKFTPIIRLISLIPNKHIISTKFLNYILDMIPITGTEGGIPQLTVPSVKKIKIPIPPLAEQNRIVAILDKFDKLVNDISEGLPAEIKARRKQYEYYREKLLNFKSIDNG